MKPDFTALEQDLIVLDTGAGMASLAREGHQRVQQAAQRLHQFLKDTAAAAKIAEMAPAAQEHG